MLTRWFKRALANCLSLGKAENPRDIRNTAIKYDPNILVKDYLKIVEIHLGRGISTPTYDNYSLEIFESAISELDIDISEVEQTIEISIKGFKTYETDSYINEVGLVGLFKGSKVLFDRTKLESTLPISAGQTLKVEYKIVL